MHLTLIVPGKLDTPTGGYIYDRRIVAGLRDLGWSVDVRELEADFPHPDARALGCAARTLASLPDRARVAIDGLALGAMPVEVERERERLELVAIVHHPLAAETGLDPSVAAALTASERRALAAVGQVVVTSRATANALDAYGVAPSRVTVVEPGTDPAPVARGSGSSTLHVLTVASVIPRKGYEVLIQALALVPDRDWRLTAVGSLTRSPETAARVRALIAEHGLADRVSLAGEVTADRVAAYYDGADLFVLPTLYEGYGMVIAEALARAVPVVSTPTGGIDALVTTGGVLVPPSDPVALAAALSRIIGSPALRDELRMGARAARERLRTWADASRQMAETLGGRVQR